MPRGQDGRLEAGLLYFNDISSRFAGGLVRGNMLYETPAKRLERQKRLTMRRPEAEGRLETLFTSLLTSPPSAIPLPGGPPVPPKLSKPKSNKISNLSPDLQRDEASRVANSNTGIATGITLGGGALSASSKSITRTGKDRWVGRFIR